MVDSRLEGWKLDVGNDSGERGLEQGFDTTNRTDAIVRLTELRGSCAERATEILNPGDRIARIVEFGHQFADAWPPCRRNRDLTFARSATDHLGQVVVLSCHRQG